MPSRIPVPLRAIATAVSVITAEDIQRSGYSSVAGVLRTRTGTDASNTGVARS